MGRTKAEVAALHAEMRRLRADGFSQVEIATRLGVSQPYVSTTLDEPRDPPKVVERFVVTGADGFIGTHLSDHLEELGHHVFRQDRRPKKKRSGLHRELSNVHVARQVMKHARPTIVIHAAAQVGREFGERDPYVTVRDNVAATVNVAREAEAYGARLVYLSTSEVYGDWETLVADEWFARDQLRPHNLYGLSKLWGEDACKLYAPGVRICRLSMPYGPGHPPGFGRAALTQFVWNAMQGRPIEVHRGAKRSWCWVGDTVDAIARVALDDRARGVYNIGRDDNETTMLEVARMACEMVEVTFDLIREVDPPPRQTVVKRLATDRIRELDWEPTIELDEGMRRVYRWLRDNEEAFKDAR